MASAAPTKRQTNAKAVLTSRLNDRVAELVQVVDRLTEDATFAIAAGEPMEHDDILVARVAALNAVNTLRATQAWRGADDDWNLDDRVGLTEDYVDA